MEFLKYEDFLFEQSKFIELQTINEASLTDSPSKDIKFGICITTYKIDEGKRGNHMTTEKVLSDCLQSIKEQSFPGWKVYVTGDGYPEDEWPEIEKLIGSIIPKDKLWMSNMKNPGERDKYEGSIVSSKENISFGDPKLYLDLNTHVIIGSQCVILPGVTIKEGTAIGSFSLVSKDVDSWGIYVGAPLKFLKSRSKDMLDFL